MTEIIQKYTNDEITIVWRPATCIHSTLCWKGQHGLPQVFKPAEKPWIHPTGGSTEEIIKRIEACPSGALSYHFIQEETNLDQTKALVQIEVKPNGPYLIHGEVMIKDKDGTEKMHQKLFALCRCGSSQNKPFCDGNHAKINFKG